MPNLEPTESHAEVTFEQRPKGVEGGSHMDPGGGGEFLAEGIASAKALR